MNESTKWGRAFMYLYHKLIGDATFQFGIRFTDKCSNSFFLINGKFISLHKVIKYVNRNKSFFDEFSAKHTPLYLHYVTIISLSKGT